MPVLVSVHRSGTNRVTVHAAACPRVRWQFASVLDATSAEQATIEARALGEIVRWTGRREILTRRTPSICRCVALAVAREG
jgi:hypothetical protein